MANKMYELFECKPRKRIGIGSLAIVNGESRFYIDEKLSSMMIRITIGIAGPTGILLTGFEEIGTNKKGIRKLKYQEWWLAYV